MPAAPLVDPKVTIPAPPFTKPKKEITAAKAIPSEIEELPVPAKAEPPLAKAEPSLTLPLTEESPSMPVQESRPISPPAPSPPEEYVVTPREEVFPETATQPVPQPEVSYPSPRRMPRWIWAAAGAAILILFGFFFIWRKQPTPAVTSSVVENPPCSKHTQHYQVYSGYRISRKIPCWEASVSKARTRLYQRYGN